MAAVTELENVKTAHAEKNISQIEALTAVEEAKVRAPTTFVVFTASARSDPVSNPLSRSWLQVL